jgi:DNA-binding transcriptional MerR regulator
MWERRYTIVRPSRSKGKSRRYSDEDIRRLSLVKTLVDAGHQISIIAPLSMEQLQKRLEATSPQALKLSGSETGPCRIIVVGSALPAKLAAAGSSVSNLELAAAFDDEDQLKRVDTFPEVDALVVEYATVQNETIGNVRRLLALCGAEKAIVVYGFGARQALLDLESAGVTCLRAPAGAADIESACGNTRAHLHPGPTTSEPGRREKVPPRQLTPQQLARISAQATVVACECPHHLVDLISSMAAFETYSLECQHKNAKDAEIHALLHATAGHARAMLEAALLRVVEFEGIDVS